MKRILYTFTALLLTLTLLFGCSAENGTESSIASESAGNDVVSSVIEESSETESSVYDEFPTVATITTEFNKDKVHYNDGAMMYIEMFVVLNYLHPVYSYGAYDAYDNAEDDDWFVVGFRGENISNELRSLIEHIGAIEIEDHPFLTDDYYVALNEAKDDSEKEAIMKERYAKMFPGADYEKDPKPSVNFGYIGHFTKPMMGELYKAVDGTSVVYTFMPEVGNNECWFENLRKS